MRAGLDAPVDRVFVRTAPDGEERFDELTEAPPGPACRWWTITLRAVDAGHGLPVPGRGPDRPLLADRHGPAARRRDRPRGLPARRRLRPALVAGRPRLLPGVPRPVRQRRPVERRRRRRLDLSRPRHPAAHVGRAAHRRPGRVDGVLRRRPRSGSSAGSTTSSTSGVNAIYLNPVFETRSNHGYDTIDYDHVAAHFGGDAALVSLRRATRERDIRLILDIAPNHTGVEHPWFLAAQADPASPTGRLLHVPSAPRRLRVVARRQVAAQARLPRRRPARRDVRRQRRDPAPVARAAVLDRRLADRRREHARPPGSRAARSGRRSRACARR